MKHINHEIELRISHVLPLDTWRQRTGGCATIAQAQLIKPTQSNLHH